MKKSQISDLGDRARGILMLLVAVVILSPHSLLIRPARLDDYTLILWLDYPADFVPALLGIGWAGRLKAVLFALLSISFISVIQAYSGQFRVLRAPTPSLNTIAGGSLLMITVAWFADSSLREEMRRP